MSNINILTLLLQEPKLEEKRFMHLQSLVSVPFLAIPVSKWPSASKWIQSERILYTEHLKLEIVKNIVKISFDGLEETLVYEFDKEIPVDVGLTTYFSNAKDDKKGFFTKSKELDVARSNLLQKNYREKVGNFFLLSTVAEWKNYNIESKKENGCHIFYYQNMLALHVGMDFVELFFHENKAGRFATPHAIRQHYYPTHCCAFDELGDIPENILKEVSNQPRFHEDTFTCGKYCPAIEFSNNYAASVVDATRELCPHLLNIPCTYNNELKSDQWTVLWDAPMGAGKSHSIRELLKKHEDWKVLVISVRIALTKSFMDDFGHDGLKFVNYQDVAGYQIDNDKLIVQIDSLHRVPQHKDWDLVILDESQSLTAHFSAETFTKASSVFTRFKKLIRDFAKRVICCDADMNKFNVERTKWFIETVCKRRIIYIHSEAENDFRRYIRLTPADDMAYRCVQLVGRGKKIVIVSNTKRFPKDIHRLLQKKFPHKRGLTIYNEANHAWNDCIEEGGHRRPINKRKDSMDFEGLDWFAYSPVVSPGVSFDTKHFDIVCAKATPTEGAAGVRYFAQLCNRMRHLNDKLVLYDIPLSTPHHFESLWWGGIMRELNDNQKIQRDFLNDYLDVEFQDGGRRKSNVVNATRDFNILWCRNESEARRSVIMFEKMFKDAKKKDGAQFYYLNMAESDAEKIKALREERQKVNKNCNEKVKKEIVNAAKIDFATYSQMKETLKSNETVSIKEWYQYKRFEFVWFNGLNDRTDEELLEDLTHLGEYNSRVEDHFLHLLIKPEEQKKMEQQSFASRNEKSEGNSRQVQLHMKVNKDILSVKTSYVRRVLAILGVNPIEPSYHTSADFKNTDAALKLIEDIGKDPHARKKFRLTTLKHLGQEKKAWKFLTTAFNIICKDMKVAKRGEQAMKGGKNIRRWSLSHIYAEKKWHINPAYIKKLKYVAFKLEHKDRFPEWKDLLIDKAEENINAIVTQYELELNKEKASATALQTDNNNTPPNGKKRELSTNNTEQPPKRNKTEGSSINNAIDLTS
eukprot:g15008.t1